MALEPNTLLQNRYRIIRELSSGGMGAVYLGHDEILGVDVAVKENLFVSPEAERQFYREATLLANLRHPNLPRVTDHFVITEQGQYLVMDFVPGDDGRILLERTKGPLPEAQVMGWATAILDALKYMHSRQPPVIHRDVKPGNIKITPEGKAVLVDFGLAKVYDPARSTTTGAKAFTPGFAPPEQYGLGRTDVRTDIYALGATLYAMLTGRPPVDSLDRAMGQAKLPAIRDLNPAVSAHVAQAVERAMAIKPDERFPNVEAFAEALSPTQGPATTFAPPSAPGPVMATVVEPVVQTRVELAPTERPGIRAQPVAPAAAPARPARSWLVPALIIAALVVVGGGTAGLILSGVGPRLIGLAPGGPSASPTESVPPTITQPSEVSIAQTESAAQSISSATPLPPAESPTPEASPTPAVTPAGGGHGQIAFVSQRVGPPQVFLMNTDGSNVSQLTNIPDGACQPAWSPDGESLLFVSPCPQKKDQYANAAIYIVNADGTGVRILISLVGGVFDPDWSESGILFTYLQGSKPRLYKAGSDGSSPVKVSQGNSADSQGSWSPGGDKIVFMNTSRAGSATLYWADKDGKFEGANPEQVTRDLRAYSPDWSPRGDLVAFVVGEHIYVIPWDKRGFGEARLTNTGPNDDPDWSPDGQWMAFESWRDSANHEIYIMTANGGMQTRLTDEPAQDYQPAWRP